jgi:predicted AlkP superfamily phosphohydrolase/phosphomutase
MTRTVVIGLDGSNWPLIQPWIDEGQLPNFAKLVDEGTHGISRSHLPPVTCPNWKCYASGKNPGKLGVYWWERIDTQTREMHLPDSTDFASPEIWDYLNDQNQTAGVVNLPMSYPPREIDEFMIAGGPRSGETNYTKPDDLQEEIEDRFDYRVHPENVLTSNENSHDEVEVAHDLLRTRLRTAHALLEERDLDFLHVTLFHLNVLQHYFWDAEETRRAYEIVDEELEPFLEGDYNLVLVSDHGCTEIDTVFYVNRWLEAQGYLATESSLASRLHDFGLTQEKVAAIVRSVGLEKYIRPLIPRPIIERFPSDEGVVREAKLDMVDWENTTAIGSGQGLVYAVADDEAERERILDSLEADLRNATGLNGEPIARSIHRPEDIYEGEYLDRAPDLIFDQRPGVHTSEAMGQNEAFSTPTNWRAENVPEGMVLFHGDDVQAGELDPVWITDVAPTILHWMGHAVPTDMDGSPVTEIFAPGTEPAERAVETRRSLPDLDEDEPQRELDGNVEDRLADIGYLE